MRVVLKSFRMEMTQERQDLFNELWELPEFRNINTQTKLLESVFLGYLKLRKFHRSVVAERKERLRKAEELEE